MKKKYRDTIQELSHRQLMMGLLFTQILLLTVSIVLGMILFDSFSSFFQLFMWNDLRILTIGGGAGIGVVLLDFILMKWLPRHFYDDGGLNERLFQNKSVMQVFVIAAMVAISEEILFRGVIQTHFGLVFTSILFALIHYRYLFNPFLFLNITLLSFLICYIYDVTGNLLVTITMHFLIDFILGLIIKRRGPHGQERMTHE